MLQKRWCALVCIAQSVTGQRCVLQTLGGMPLQVCFGVQQSLNKFATVWCCQSNLVVCQYLDGVCCLRPQTYCGIGAALRVQVCTAFRDGCVCGNDAFSVVQMTASDLEPLREDLMQLTLQDAEFEAESPSAGDMWAPCGISVAQAW